jgi:prepilin-type N-terminal cleavage/methylation domain-containing protein
MLILMRCEMAKYCNIIFKQTASCGFALIEVLVAASIASIVVLSIYSGVSSGASSVARNPYYTRAIIIAQTKLAEFRLNGMRGTDLLREEVKGNPGFTFTRETARYENPLFSMLPAKKTTITVEWGNNGKYSLFTVYIE